MNYKTNRFVVLSCVFFVIYTLLSFAFYYERTLQGDLNNHILAGEIFGVPQALKQHGIKPLYHGTDSGWDGQFYYYMSNDLLAQKDTSKHIDAPSYRYQRIGLSLYAAIIAKLMGMDWVSPTLYLISYFVLILLATYVGARLFLQLGSYPSFILLWALGVGTQITLFNGLPDGAADAFLILGLSAMLRKRHLLATGLFTFSALSREVYVLFPSCIFLFYLIDSLRTMHVDGHNNKKILADLLKGHIYYLYLIPGMIAVLWHIYIVHHFGIAPSAQAFGVLGLPLVSWFNYLQSGLYGNHLFVGKGFACCAETILLVFFLAITMTSFFVSVSILVKRFGVVPVGIRGIAFAVMLMGVLYSSFGPIIMMHYTGYFKAIGVLFFLLPLLLVVGNFPKKFVILAIFLLVTAVIFATNYNMKKRLLQSPGIDKYTQMSTVINSNRMACFGEYKAEVKVCSVTFLNQNAFLRILRGNQRQMVVHVSLTNTSRYAMISSKNVGGVFMASQWVDVNNKVVSNGLRSAIPGILQPGDSAKIDVITSIPSRAGRFFLRLSPVQEGCAWFHLENPSVTSPIQFVVGES